MKVELEGVCQKEQLHELPFISFPVTPPILHPLTPLKSHSNAQCLTAAADGLQLHVLPCFT